MALLDKLLQTTVDPIGGLLQDPQAYQTQKNIGTGTGAVAGYLSSLYKGYSPAQKALATLQGAQSGRQGIIDRYTKGYMTQQELAKMAQEFQRTKQQIDIDKYTLADKTRRELSFIEHLQNASPEEIKLMSGDFDAYIDAKIKSTPSLAAAGEIKYEDQELYNMIGADPRNPTPKDIYDVKRIKEGVSSKEQAELKQKAAVDGYKRASITGALESAVPKTKQQILEQVLRERTLGEPSQPHIELEPKVKPVSQLEQQQEVSSKPTDAIVNTEWNTSVPSNKQTISSGFVPTIKNDKVSLEVKDKLIAEKGQIAKTANDSLNSLNRFEATVMKLLNSPNLNSIAGFGAEKLSEIRGTQAFSLMNEINSLDGAALTTELAKMKAISPNGSAGLGQLSEKEGERIVRALSKVKAGLPYDDLVQVLNELNTSIKNAKDIIKDGFYIDYGDIEGIKETQYLPEILKLDTEQGQVNIFTGNSPQLLKSLGSSYNLYDLNPNEYYTIVNGKPKKVPKNLLK